MKRILWITGFLFIASQALAQSGDSLQNRYQNTAAKMLMNKQGLQIGGYGNVDYNQPFGGDTRQNGKMDVHRFILLFGYHFNQNTSLITEVEFEHVKEVYIEQAFLNHRINNNLNIRGGLMLVPMGIINEYHESTTFNGVERPRIDKYIAPTTWREIGLGISGNLPSASLRYQAYVLNGFNGYDGNANLGGGSGMRGGRQKAAKSYISAPNFAGRVSYYGIMGLNAGLSFYSGKSQSTLYDGLDPEMDAAVERADSSAVGLNMLGFDLRYQTNGIQAKGQLYYSMLNNTEAYNTFTGSDLGSAMTGYYAELAYDVLHTNRSASMQLLPFFRYSQYNTHAETAGELQASKAYQKTIMTTGLTLKLSKGAAFKTDVQFRSSEAEDAYNKYFNMGVAFWF